MRFIGTIIASIALATVAASAQTGAPQRQSAPDERRKADADQLAPPPTATIRYGANALRSGELRLPKGKGPFPVAIVIHGGCFVAEMGGTGLQSFAEALRQRGIATWDIDYRRVGHPGGGWPGSFEDVAAGVDHLPALAKRYPLDLTRVTTVGHSAGALFALWAAARPKLPAPWTSKAGSPRIGSTVAIDGPGTLASLVGPDVRVCGRPVIVPLMGGTPAEQPEPYRIASAMDHLPLGVPQLLVFSELGPFMQPYAAKARAAGDTVLTLTPPNADHFDIVTSGAPNGEAVADWIAANAFKPKG